MTDSWVIVIELKWPEPLGECHLVKKNPRQDAKENIAKAPEKNFAPLPLASTIKLGRELFQLQHSSAIGTLCVKNEAYIS